MIAGAPGRVKPTPTPWSIHGGNLIRIGGGYQGRTTIAGVHRLGAHGGIKAEGDAGANADLIVRAVNAHDAMVAALKEARQFVQHEIERRDFSTTPRSDADPSYVDDAKAAEDLRGTINAALKLAEG